MSKRWIGASVPEFSLECVDGKHQSRIVTPADFAGQWLAVVFYPRDFSFVCPTELIAFSGKMSEFEARGCQMLGVSVDVASTHQSWLDTPAASGGMQGLQFPLASDPQGKFADQLGMWYESERICGRGLILVDPQGKIQYYVLHPLNIGRNVDEILRVLDALQSGGMCPVNWTKADGTIDVSNALKPGVVLGHYRIEEEIGKGNFGRVFAARDIHLDRRVALKVLHESNLMRADQILKEAKFAAQLEHPNICRVYSIEFQDGMPIICMQWIDGTTMHCKDLTEFSREDRLRILARLAAGLHYAHERGVIHGDLKPANLMVDEQANPFLLDFGLAKSHRTNEEEAVDLADAELLLSKLKGPIDKTAAWTMEFSTDSLSKTQRSISGTPKYMAPEQLLGARASFASDWYSFGLVFYEWMTGEAARQGGFAEWIQPATELSYAEKLANRLPFQEREFLQAVLHPAAEERPTSQQCRDWMEELAGASLA